MKKKLFLLIVKSIFIAVLLAMSSASLKAQELGNKRQSSLAERKAALKRRGLPRGNAQSAQRTAKEIEELKAIGWEFETNPAAKAQEPRKSSANEIAEASIIAQTPNEPGQAPASIPEPQVPSSPARAPVSTPIDAPTAPGGSPDTNNPQGTTAPVEPESSQPTSSQTQTLTNILSNDPANSEESAAAPTANGQQTVGEEEPSKTVLINFNNVSVIEYIRFISRISNKNFIFDEADLDFNITVISEEPATIDNIIAALFQELRVHDLTILEEGNNIVIHRNPGVNSISNVGAGETIPETTEMVTQVFRLNTLDPLKAAAVVKPLTSTRAMVEVLENTNNLVITDLVGNVKLIAKLLKSLDAPSGGLVVGQYVVRNGVLDSLVTLGQQIMLPIAQDQQLIFVPHTTANSIFIVSTPFLVEKSISILQRLDQNQGTTRIYELNDLNIQGRTTGTTEGGTTPGVAGEGQGLGRWDLDSQGNWIFKPNVPEGGANAPTGRWFKDANGNWYFVPEGAASPFTEQEALDRAPKGRWEKDTNGQWVFRLSSGESISAEPILRNLRPSQDLPVGHIERTKFFIHKLQYRRGDDIQRALSKIGESLYQLGQGNEDLIATINTVQWLEASNSLIFTGTSDAIRKVEELIAEVDTPLRQVFIEMLILETSLDDSLNLGVNWGTRFGGGNTAGSQAFLTAASALPGALDTTGIINGNVLTPTANSLARTAGYNGGIVGQDISLGSLTYRSIGALIKALHDKTNTNILMNPKILTEDNVTAEIFVGINTPFRTQSISNDQGSIITSNVEFRNVGTTLKVTPFLGNNDIVTLEIREEVSSVGGAVATDILSDQNPGPTTRLSRTTTRVHVPDKYFLVISGMMQDEETRRRVSVPCLGGLPIIGAAFSDKNVRDQKRNLMIFIRPEIIDTEEEIQNLTKHQQDVFRYQNETKRSWKYEVDEGMDFFNLRSTERFEACEACEDDVKNCK